MKPSIARSAVKLRRAAPVLLDILADHYLALTWPHYPYVSTADFTAEACIALRRFDAYVLNRGRPFIERMIDPTCWRDMASQRCATACCSTFLSQLWFPHLNPKLASFLDAQLPAFVEDFHGYLPKLHAFVVAERQRCFDGQS